ncbi:MAG: hypothetical protein E6H63_15300 [Betaproteobacteria bacterium]|nr:MAG: hypothetical protein E6H63_15300 [Betaproteobacteria bacterium]TMH43571.1 MAG: hypothetical protein E6H54_11055 [Betaproteobacteria bacterium]
MRSSPNRAKIALYNVNIASQHRISQAKKTLASSRSTARLARIRIGASRKRLSQSGDTVVATAACISAARAALGNNYR